MENIKQKQEATKKAVDYYYKKYFIVGKIEEKEPVERLKIINRLINKFLKKPNSL